MGLTPAQGRVLAAFLGHIGCDCAADPKGRLLLPGFGRGGIQTYVFTPSQLRMMEVPKSQSKGKSVLSSMMSAASSAATSAAEATSKMAAAAAAAAAAASGQAKHTAFTQPFSIDDLINYVAKYKLSAGGYDIHGSTARAKSGRIGLDILNARAALSAAMGAEGSQRSVAAKSEVEKGKPKSRRVVAEQEEQEREKDWAHLVSLWHCMLRELCTLQEEETGVLDFMNSILPNLHHVVRKKIDVKFVLTELSATIK